MHCGRRSFACGRSSPLPRRFAKCPPSSPQPVFAWFFVEALSGSKIDGACFWLDAHKPVIGMTLRFDRIDNFWFVLRHEIEHVLREDGRTENWARHRCGTWGVLKPTFPNASDLPTKPEPISVFLPRQCKVSSRMCSPTSRKPRCFNLLRISASIQDLCRAASASIESA
ncbi:hypothetical protein Ddc_22202 [Ditylenchus destructor]|nr:hypothetical protein Ddc_22202 [Ditylenchus destructor]